MFMLLYIMIGALAGLLAGLLGIGGGIIVVPALVAVFIHFSLFPASYIMHIAIGTSLAVMVVTLLSAMQAYHRKGSVRWDMVRSILPGLITGSLIGALVAHDLPSRYLQVILGGFLLFAAYRLLRARVHPLETVIQPKLPVIFLVSAVIGIFSSMLGAGGGTLMMPFLLWCRLDMVEAAGTTIASCLWMAITATICFMVLGSSTVILPGCTGYIYWPAFLGVAGASMLFAPLGSGLAHRLPTARLKQLLAACLIIIALKILIR